MNLKGIKSTTCALLVAGLAMLLTGTYTDNGGFQLAGGMLIFITLILALRQAGAKKNQLIKPMASCAPDDSFKPILLHRPA